MKTLKTIFKIFLISTFLFSCGGGGGGGFARPEGMPDPDVVPDETPAASLFGDWTCTSKVKNIDCESEQELEGLDINENQEEQDEFRITQTADGCKFEGQSLDEVLSGSNSSLHCRSGGNQVSIEWHDQQSNNGCTAVADLTGLFELNEDQSKLEGEVGVFTDVTDSCPAGVKDEVYECMIIVDVSCEPSSASQTFEVPDLPASPDLFGIWDCVGFFESQDCSNDASESTHYYYQFTSTGEGCEAAALNLDRVFLDNIECRAGGDVLVLTEGYHYESGGCVRDVEYNVKFELTQDGSRLRGQPGAVDISESGNCLMPGPVSDQETGCSESYRLRCHQVEMSEIDHDGDGVFDEEDNCPDTSNPGQEDNDGDGRGTVCETDADMDGVADEVDNCLTNSNPNQWDADYDGIGDVCEEDADEDGVIDDDDNCPEIPNPHQNDDICVDDEDADAISEDHDNCPLVHNPDQRDSDRDGYGDACDDEGPPEVNCNNGCFMPTPHCLAENRVQYSHCVQCLEDDHCEPLLGLQRRCISHSCIAVAPVQQCNLISDCLLGYVCLNGHCMPPLGW